MQHFDYTIDHDSRFIVTTWKGAFTLEDANACIARFLSDPNFDRTYNGIADLSGAVYLMNLDDIDQHHGFVVSHPNHPLGAWAILCAAPLQTAMAYVYGNRAEGLHASNVFSTREAAEEWLQQQ